MSHTFQAPLSFPYKSRQHLGKGEGRERRSSATPDPTSASTRPGQAALIFGGEEGSSKRKRWGWGGEVRGRWVLTPHLGTTAMGKTLSTRLGWVSRRPGKTPSSTAPTETPVAGDASPPTPAATLPSTATISPPTPQGYSESREEGYLPSTPLLARGPRLCPKKCHQNSTLAHQHPPSSPPAAAPRALLPSTWPSCRTRAGGCGGVVNLTARFSPSLPGGENGLRLFGFYQPLLDQAAIEFLNVCVHTLPIRLAHPDHVLHVQQLRTVCVLPGGREREGQASDRSPVGEGEKERKQETYQCSSRSSGRRCSALACSGGARCRAGQVQAPPRSKAIQVRFGGPGLTSGGREGRGR